LAPKRRGWLIGGYGNYDRPMTARLTEIVIDCHDPHRLAEFWAAVLGYRITSTADDEVEISGASNAPCLLFISVPETKSVKNRLHLDVNAVDTSSDEELHRLLALGATTLDIGQGEQTWTVLADPEGNEFCLLSGTVPAEPGSFVLAQQQ
jgi:catechol-2,3-dioxygenase